MLRRQTAPKTWLIVNAPIDSHRWSALRELPHESGILVLHPLSGGEKRRLRLIARLRGHTVVTDVRGRTPRVHCASELTRAILRRPLLIMISPIFPTATHPTWLALPRMRAAALARLCGRRAVALGGMNSSRYARVSALGFIGWAGVSAFRI